MKEYLQRFMFERRNQNENDYVKLGKIRKREGERERDEALITVQCEQQGVKEI